MKKISKFFNGLFAINSTAQPQTTKLLAIEGEFVRPGQIPAEVLKDSANFRVLIFLKDKNLTSAWQTVFAKRQPEIYILENHEIKISTLLTHHVIWEAACHKYVQIFIVTGLSSLKSISSFLESHHIDTSIHYVEENRAIRQNKHRSLDRKYPRRDTGNVITKESNSEKHQMEKNNPESVETSKDKVKQPQRKPKIAESNTVNAELETEKPNDQIVIENSPVLDKSLVEKFITHLSKQIELNVPIRKGYIGTLVNQATGKPSVEVFPGGLNPLILFLTQRGCINEIDRQTCLFTSFPEVSLFEKYPLPTKNNNPDSGDHSRGPRNRRRDFPNRKKVE